MYLKIDSSLTTQRSDDVTVQYGGGIATPGAWEIGLIKVFCWYSYSNIAAEFSNNIIRYAIGGVVQPDIVIPDGIYSIVDLNDYMQGVMRTRGDWDSVNELYYVSITPNINTLRCVLTLSNTYSVDMSAGNLYAVLGFSAINYTVTASGTGQVDITRGVNALEINCSVTDASYSNEISGNGIYSFVPNQPPGYSLEITPNPVIYLPVNVQRIDRIRMWITDQQGRKINFNGENVTYMLHLRKAA